MGSSLLCCDHEPAAASRERAHHLGRLRTCFEHDMKRRVRCASRGLDGRLYHRVADVQRFALADVARLAETTIDDGELQVLDYPFARVIGGTVE